MLQSMHDKIQGWIAGVIAGVISLTFILWGVQSFRSDKQRVIAKVSGIEITEQQLQAALEQAKSSLFMRLGKRIALSHDELERLKHDLLHQLINDHALLAAEQRMGLRMTHEQLLPFVMNLPFFQEDGKFSAQLYRQLVPHLFGSEENFLANLRMALMHNQLSVGVMHSGFMLPYEEELIQKALEQRRDFSYVRIPFDNFIKDIHLDDDEIKQYYENHLDEFVQPEQVKLQYLELDPDQIKEQVKVTAEDIKNFYQENTALFTSAQVWTVTRLTIANSTFPAAERAAKIEELLVEWRKNPDFKPTQDGIKIENDVNITAGKRLTQRLEDELTNLQIGDITKPIQQKGKTVILKITAIQPAKLKPYEQVVQQATEWCQKQRAAQAFAQRCEELAEAVYVHPDQLTAAAQQFNLKLYETELFAQKDSANLTGILNEPVVLQAAFNELVLQGNNSELLTLPSGKVVVIRAKEHIPEGNYPLTQVATQIRTKLVQEKAENRAAELANTLLENLTADKTVVDLLKEYGLVWQKMNGAQLTQRSALKNLVKEVFELAQAEHAATVVNDDEAYFIVKLDRVYEDLNKTDKKQLEKISANYRYRFNQFELDNLVNKLIERASVKIYSV